MTKYIAHGTTAMFASELIGGLTAINPSGRSKGDVRTTDNDSDFDEEYIPGIREGGTIQLEMRHDPDDAGQVALQTNFEADRTVEECVITLPDEASTGSGYTTFTFDAYVNDFPIPQLPLESNEPAMRTVTLKVAGAVTEAIA